MAQLVKDNSAWHLQDAEAEMIRTENLLINIEKLEHIRKKQGAAGEVALYRYIYDLRKNRNSHPQFCKKVVGKKEALAHCVALMQEHLENDYEMEYSVAPPLRSETLEG